MISAEENARVDKRLQVYSPETQLNNYINTAQEVGSLCYAILMGQGLEAQSLSQDNVEKLKRSLSLKKVEAKLYADAEYQKIRAEDEASNKNIERIKAAMKETLPRIKKLKEEFNQRNKVLRAYNSDIDMVNDRLKEMHKGKSRLTASREKWEQKLGTETVAKLIASKILVVRFGKANTEELSVYSDFSQDTMELRKQNSMMKGDIQRLKEELDSYKSKWLHDVGLVDKIRDVLRDEIDRRQLPTSSSTQDVDEMDVDENNPGDQTREASVDTGDSYYSSGIEIDESVSGGDEDSVDNTIDKEAPSPSI
ncbi:LAMI_0H01310g1_1 [Lachancea mirantina]|uniref:LAMI_0H01310g1_1 n=1 Tax=Lachancea mirantina TaxID=1230905 RepID=A0A1G4KDU9_9SACH|nr:LAMI_0H01310g1_1 [Lachancea mirantina]